MQEIASAKAGILKPGRPAIIAQHQEPEALAVLQQCAQSQGCRVIRPQGLESLVHLSCCNLTLFQYIVIVLPWVHVCYVCALELAWLCAYQPDTSPPGVGMQGIVTENGQRRQRVRVSLDDNRSVRGTARNSVMHAHFDAI